MDVTERALTDAAFPRSDFYVTGGTLRPDAPSYVERQADKDLCRSLNEGDFCYVLTSRQMGKSSLMVRTVKKLREDGVAVAVLDLTGIGQNLTIDQWYDGLISRLGQQLRLEDELLDYWEAHPELGPLQRWLTAIEKVVLQKIQSRIVIFVDEIDVVRSLPFSTDEFFAAIREAFNRRSQEPTFHRLAFGLLGVASPTDLIRNPHTTPFNIGRRIELNDFTPLEAAPLAKGLGPDDTTAHKLLARVLYWTGGHPYLTQRLCRALADSLQAPVDASTAVTVPPVIPDERTVDRFADALFLSKQARERDDNLVFVRERILRSEVDVAGMLYLYRRALNHERVPDDDTNPLVSELRLSGVVRGRSGVLQVRNRVYGSVFDLGWITANMPAAEVRRQRGARRKGVLMGLSIAVGLLLVYLFLWPVYTSLRRTRTARNTLERMRAAYERTTTYADTFESTLEIGVGGLAVPVRSSGSAVYQASSNFSLVMRSGFSDPEIELRIATDGRVAWLQLPHVREFRVQQVTPSSSALDMPAPLAARLGPGRLLLGYRFLLEPGTIDAIISGASSLRLDPLAEFDGQRVRVLSWRQNAYPILKMLGVTNAAAKGEAHVPMTAWVSTPEYRLLQVRVDLSAWAKLLTTSDGPNVSGLILTEVHRNIKAGEPVPRHARFRFVPTSGWTHVLAFSEPVQPVTTLSVLKNQFARMIPKRLLQAPRNLLDLTEFYNAPLNQAWHPGLPANSLDALPPGILMFGETAFDVRGVVQLSGKLLEKAGGRFPRVITGIPVGSACSMLHFLHACGWRSADGVRIGEYIVNYEDGEKSVIPVVYGAEVRDWSRQSDPSNDLKHADLVWNVVNGAGVPIRLFKTTWVNPLPSTPIISIDYVSAMQDSAPFVIAITADE